MLLHLELLQEAAQRQVLQAVLGQVTQQLGAAAQVQEPLEQEPLPLEQPARQRPEELGEGRPAAVQHLPAAHVKSPKHFEGVG